MDDITVSALTLKGSRHGDPPRFSLLERAQAARQAGLTSLGVDVGEHPGKILLDYVTVPELEWADVGEPVTGRDLEQILAACQALGVTRVNAGVCGAAWRRDFRSENAYIAENVATLAWALAPLNVTVAVEPVAFGGLRGVADVLDVVNQARQDTPNVGILLDMWQFTADDPAWPQTPIDPGLIAEVQLCGTPGRAYPPGTRRRVIFAGSQDRPYTAQSPHDVAGWFRRLLAAGYTGPVSYEVPRRFNQFMRLNGIAQRAAADIAWVRARALGEPVTLDG